MADDYIIAGLKYGREHLDGVNQVQFIAHMRARFPDLTPAQLNGLYEKGFAFFGDPGNRWSLTLDSYFNLLEHEGLQEARASSRRAQTWALVAIGVSIIAMVISSFFAGLQLVTPTTISDTQVTRVFETGSRVEAQLVETGNRIGEQLGELIAGQSDLRDALSSDDQRAPER